MKKYFIFLSLIIGSARAQQQRPTGFHIEGHVKGISEKSDTAVTDGNKPTDTLARARVKDGSFILTGHVIEPNLLVLNFVSAQKKTTLFIRNETVTVN